MRTSIPFFRASGALVLAWLLGAHTPLLGSPPLQMAEVIKALEQEAAAFENQRVIWQVDQETFMAPQLLAEMRATLKGQGSTPSTSGPLSEAQRVAIEGVLDTFAAPDHKATQTNRIELTCLSRSQWHALFLPDLYEEKHAWKYIADGTGKACLIKPGEFTQAYSRSPLTLWCSLMIADIPNLVLQDTPTLLAQGPSLIVDSSGARHSISYPSKATNFLHLVELAKDSLRPLAFELRTGDGKTMLRIVPSGTWTGVVEWFTPETGQVKQRQVWNLEKREPLVNPSPGLFSIHPRKGYVLQLPGKDGTTLTMDASDLKDRAPEY